MRSILLVLFVFLFIGCIQLNINYPKNISANNISAQHIEVSELKLNGNDVLTTTTEFKGDVYGTYDKLKFRLINNEDIKNYSINKTNVNSSQIQLRISDKCRENEAIREILENGSVICQNVISQTEMPTLSQVLNKGNMANNEIKNITSIYVNQICLNGDCLNDWDHLNPDLKTVLEENNNANGNDIKNVNKIEVNKICLNGDCINNWDEIHCSSSSNSLTNYTLNKTIELYSCDNINHNSGKTCSILDDMDFCALAGTTFSTTSHLSTCMVNLNSHKKWEINAPAHTRCYVYCFKIELVKNN